MASVTYIDTSESSPQPGPQDDGRLVLPGFIGQRPDGVHIDVAAVPSADEFKRIVDRVFATGHYFGNLDYAAFQRLLFDFDEARGLGDIRLASEIKEFPAARRQLYRAVKLQDGEVEYIFEPVLLETTVDEPVYAPGEDGQPVVVGTETKVVAEKAELDADEFVADMWAKGVRFGLDIPRIREIIASGKSERVVIARERQPTAGVDAGIEEQTEELHRDNAPRELSNGKLDLRQFKNRFPQIKKGTLLLLKTPRELGKPGRAVDGRILEPELPKDFDINTLAGEGTRIEKHGDGEYIVAAMDGFLSLDTKTNQVSVTEKIINREGVSARTTGNLALAGDEYEEFGEVQDGRVVQGKGLTFHANVYGRVQSLGGTIRFEQNIAGGAALNRRGDILVNGLASNAVLQTAAGSVVCKRAENSVIIAERVELEWATNCTILADEIEIDVSEGCALAGKRIHVATGRSRGDNETLISLLMPDVSGFAKAQEEERNYIGECEQLMERLRQSVEAASKEPTVQQYLAIAGKLQRKEITLTPAQMPQWQKLAAHVAPKIKQVSQAKEDIKSLEAEILAIQKRIVRLEKDKDKAASGLSCAVDTVFDQVVVRQLILPLDAAPLARLAPKDLTQRLRGSDPLAKRLFAGHGGEFRWPGEGS